MARAGLKDHPKFRRLVYILREPVPHVWGYLECLWATAYQQRSDRIGDKIDVELSADYPGEPGKLCDALVQAGFIDRAGDVYYVHDLADHAPPYVRRTLKIVNPGSQVEQKHDARSTTGRPPVDLDTQSDDFRSTTGLQGKGKGKGEGRVGIEENPPTPLAIESTTASDDEEFSPDEEPSPDKPPPRKANERDAAWLSRLWLLHRKGAHTEPDRQSAGNFEDLLADGHSVAAIEDAIASPDRRKSESIWDFCRRLSPKKARAPTERLSGTKAFLEQSRREREKAGAT